ncbi:MAG: tRNA pseudouridine(38-40) synthase TruA [Bacilli bacterium]|nr:tRNA pseudouridine(38-40) synthase TruA [Bacilli bacterium]
MRYLMTFSYDGSKYNGYQKQPKVKTIQGELEKALKVINSEEKVEVSASGRTDAKVHALKQKAHFDLTKKMPPDGLRKALNSLLPPDIYIKDMEIVSDDFHARYNVRAKEYVYRINMGEYDPIEKDYIYQYNKRLDTVEMERALKYIEGTHDFKSFSKTDDEKDDFVRTIVQTSLIRDIKNVNMVTISFLGTGFLRYMVRNLVGTLIEIGEGKRKSEDVIDIIEAKDRRKAGKTANPEGLYLKDVFY